MTEIVNPPPQLKLPKRFLTDPETRAYFEQQQRIMYQLWRRTGGADDTIGDLASINFSNFNGQLQDIRKELEGKPEFTIDSTGFTADSTLITADKVIA
jgi:hypothetical protein